MAKDKDRFRELLTQKVAIKNTIMVDEYGRLFGRKGTVSLTTP